eukprot:9530941-Heterocapsa_arctica.AAC.1
MVMRFCLVSSWSHRRFTSICRIRPQPRFMDTLTALRPSDIMRRLTSRPISKHRAWTSFISTAPELSAASSASQ